MKLIIKPKVKSLMIISFLSFILVIILIFIYQDYQRQLTINNLPNNLQFPVAKEKIVSFAEYPNPQNPQEPIMQYIYGTTKEAPADNYQGLNEDMTKRTPSSQSFIKEIKKIDADQEQITYVSKFYAGTSFYQAENNNWYYTEVATTTKTAFLQQAENTLVDSLKNFFGEPVFAATDTTYSGVGDGEVSYSVNNDICDSTQWTSIHDALTGSAVNYTGTTFYITSGCTLLGGDDILIRRAFLPFNTASLPDDASISVASLNLNPSVKIMTDGSFVTVVQTTQASNTILITADYDQCGAISNPTEGVDVGNRVFGVSITAENYFSLVLNATGRSWISKTGYTKLGTREGNDVLNIYLTGFGYRTLGMYASEETGTTKDPYLSITYATIFSRVKIDGGRIKIDGGRLKIN